MEGDQSHSNKSTVSSWRIMRSMIPSIFKLVRVVLIHPRPAFKMLREAQGAKKRLRAKYNSTQRQYEIPAFEEKMRHQVLNKVYLRPSRYIESDAPEIIATANHLGAFRKPEFEFANACFNFVKMKVWFTFAAELRGAVGTLKLGEGMCLDKTHLFIALCRSAGIPARFRMSQEAFSQNIYEQLTLQDPIMRDWYNSTGYFMLHAMAEAYINGEWVPADFSMDYRYEAGLGLPLSRLGDEPEGTWNWALPGSVLRFEYLPPVFAFFTSRMLKMNTGMMLTLQERMETEGLGIGEKALAEAGGAEAYDRKIRQTYKAVLPEVSKKLFKALKETGTPSSDSDGVKTGRVKSKGG
jgi:transglutaminase-like putative cysteine protease